MRHFYTFIFYIFNSICLFFVLSGGILFAQEKSQSQRIYPDDHEMKPETVYFLTAEFLSQVFKDIDTSLNDPSLIKDAKIKKIQKYILDPVEKIDDPRWEKARVKLLKELQTKIENGEENILNNQK